MSTTLATRRVARRAVQVWWRDAAGLTAWLSVLSVVALRVGRFGVRARPAVLDSARRAGVPADRAHAERFAR